MKAVWAIAHATLREALRDKVPYVLLFFAVVVILGSEAMAVLAIGAEEKVAIDLGLGAIAFFGAVIAVFLGLSQLSREISRRTIFTVLSKPIPRSLFVVGKLLGVYATVTILVFSMGTLFLLFIKLRFGLFSWNLCASIWLSLVENFLLAAIAILFSTVTSTVLASLLTMMTYVIGHLSYGLEMLAKFPVVAETIWARVLMLLFYILPNLEWLNVRGFAVHGDPLPYGVVLPTLYGIVYAVAALLISLEVFRRKDFI